MNPLYPDHEAYRAMLERREQRLRRMLLHRQDGHGRTLDAWEMRLLQHAVKATSNAWIRDFLEHQGIPQP